MKEKIKRIQVLGSGCPTCKELLELTEQAVQELNLGIEVEYITDINKMVEMGTMTTPVLAINGQPVLTGGGKTIEEIKKNIQEKGELGSVDNSASCSCGGNC